jgi:hypothetical protein
MNSVRMAIFWIIANATDAITTYIVFQLGGIELNPFPAFVLARFGVTTFWSLKTWATLALPVVMVYLSRRYPYAKDYPWRLMELSTALITLVTGLNLWQIVR